MQERLILVTNDDGWNAKGLQAAIEVAKPFGRVVAVAPETTQSGMSQAVTTYRPRFLKKRREGAGGALRLELKDEQGYKKAKEILA